MHEKVKCKCSFRAELCYCKECTLLSRQVTVFAARGTESQAHNQIIPFLVSDIKFERFPRRVGVPHTSKSAPFNTRGRRRNTTTPTQARVGGNIKL
ncbi:hypothetical protein E2C01_071898 [Portunus trituberculatus]|uniref:Uncharacterized protein n=1 Tax=Portunus trituberculatus TaxID=210409 RepID=A0A5B7I5P4_PORTR|nr:hypothetical protein [Portunus trituberculatus]